MKKAVVKEYFELALFELLKNEEYESITIGKLCQKAGVCRSSFYRNYLVISNIVDEYLLKIFTDMKPAKQSSLREEMEEMFENLLTEKEKLLLLSKRGLLNNLFQYMYKETLSEINSLNVLNNYYQPYFFAGASSAVIKAWIDDGMKETPKQMSELFLLSLKGYMEIK